MESAFEPLDDLISVGMIGELLDWARLDPVLMRLADPSRTYLCGHSRVGPLGPAGFVLVEYNHLVVFMLYVMRDAQLLALHKRFRYHSRHATL